MNMEWIRRTQRLDVDLAVALELAAGMLVRARTPAQMEAAVGFNLRLWSIIRSLASRCVGFDREGLADGADHVATMLAADAYPWPDPRDIAFIAGRNLALSGDLAGSAAAGKGRDCLLAEWVEATHSVGFAPWLMARLEAVI